MRGKEIGLGRLDTTFLRSGDGVPRHQLGGNATVNLGCCEHYATFNTGNISDSHSRRQVLSQLLEDGWYRQRGHTDDDQVTRREASQNCRQIGGDTVYHACSQCQIERLLAA